MVADIKSLGELNEKLAENGDKLVVVHLYSTSSDTNIDDLSTKYTDIVFYKVNIDEDQTIAFEYKIETVPTFSFFKNKEQVDMMVGDNVNELKNLIDKHH